MTGPASGGVLDPFRRPLPAQPRGGAVAVSGWWRAPLAKRGPLEIQLGERLIAAHLAPHRPATPHVDGAPRGPVPQPAPTGVHRPEGRRFWAIVPVGTQVPGAYPVQGRAGAAGRWLGLGEVPVAAPVALPEEDPPPPGTRIAVCMAAYRPTRKLLERQLDSLRAQSLRHWVAYIQDDGSDEDSAAALAGLCSKDPRFRLARNPENLGFYGNFEAALRRVPASVPHIAFADQDDVWHPDKLAASVQALEAGADLVYCDARIVEAGGRVLSPTFWTRKAPNRGDFEAMVLANTVSGAGAAFRRELLDVLLPFPRLAGMKLYHDHWAAVVAAAGRGVTYLDRPLYDYVQHPGADTGHFDRSRKREGGGGPRRERLAETVRQEDLRRELLLHTLRERMELAPARARQVDSLLGTGGVVGQLGWLLGRVVRGHLRSPGWKQWLRRLELGLRG